MGVLGGHTNVHGESAKEVGPRSQGLVAKNGSAVIAESFLDTVTVEDSQSNRCLSTSLHR
jgi:hypothetical protein